MLSAGWRNEGGIPREVYPRTQKLAFIPHVEGDLFPAWYHFWGMMTYSYYLSARTAGLPAIGEMYGLLWASLEEIYGLRLLGRPLEAAITRLELDFSGAQAGAHLYRTIKKLKKNREGTIEKLTKIVTSKSSYLDPQRFSLKAGLQNMRRAILVFFQQTYNFIKSPLAKNGARKNETSHTGDSPNTNDLESELLQPEGDNLKSLKSCVETLK